MLDATKKISELTPTPSIHGEEWLEVIQKDDKGKWRTFRITTEQLRGLKGDKGDTGDSAYQAALDEGFVGTRQGWLLSLVGPQGIQGVQGPKGNDGPMGPEGLQGERGQQGAAGEQGAQGPRGFDGPDGPAGPIGPQGEDGDNGKSAYEYAQDAGYMGTEAQFAELLIKTWLDDTPDDGVLYVREHNKWTPMPTSTGGAYPEIKPLSAFIGGKQAERWFTLGTSMVGNDFMTIHTPEGYLHQVEISDTSEFFGSGAAGMTMMEKAVITSETPEDCFIVDADGTRTQIQIDDGQFATIDLSGDYLFKYSYDYQDITITKTDSGEVVYEGVFDIHQDDAMGEASYPALRTRPEFMGGTIFRMIMEWHDVPNDRWYHDLVDVDISDGSVTPLVRDRGIDSVDVGEYIPGTSIVNGSSCSFWTRGRGNPEFHVYSMTAETVNTVDFISQFTDPWMSVANFNVRRFPDQKGYWLAAVTMGEQLQGTLLEMNLGGTVTKTTPLNPGVDGMGYGGFYFSGITDTLVATYGGMNSFNGTHLLDLSGNIIKEVSHITDVYITDELNPSQFMALFGASINTVEQNVFFDSQGRSL